MVKLTGEELYKLYQEAWGDVGSDSWEQLEQEEKDMWQRFAEKLND